MLGLFCASDIQFLHRDMHSFTQSLTILCISIHFTLRYACRGICGWIGCIFTDNKLVHLQRCVVLKLPPSKLVVSKIASKNAC